MVTIAGGLEREDRGPGDPGSRGGRVAVREQQGPGQRLRPWGEVGALNRVGRIMTLSFPDSSHASISAAVASARDSFDQSPVQYMVCLVIRPPVISRWCWERLYCW
jgi:hypothetical protein